MTRRVVKVGGSLLLREDLVSSLSHWMEAQSPSETLIVVGGGRLIDAVRELDRLRPDDPEAVHWTCVELLNATGRMLARWFEWPCVESQAACSELLATQRWSQETAVVLPTAFYHADVNPTAISLPHDWRTTTDSIAGLLACLAGADELVLLKTCDVDVTRSLTQLAADEIVDSALPGIEKHLPRVRVERLI
ncbi:MAG: aspartate kinase [Rubripirellula sp.]